MSEATDINVLHDLKNALGEVGVYEWYEVEQFITHYFNGDDAGDTLSPIIDTATARFTDELELEHKDKVDFKIKTKQFVKIYGQVASIITFNKPEWEKLFWFLKFLIPKLAVNDPESDAIDGLLESVDLSTYGLQRVILNKAISLTDDEAIVDPQNPNPRGVHGGDDESDSLDEIIRIFNERWFQGWSATPDEQRIKIVNIVESIRNHKDFEVKYQNNTDPYIREVAFEKMLKEVMLQRRKDELELYKLYAGDSAFKTSWTQSIQSMIG